MTATATRAPPSPYQGLRSYTEEDADFFFGRDEEIDIIVANLRASRLTVLYGPSGVGKTSLLRAGVEAQLRKVARTNYEQLGTPEFVTVLLSAWQDDPSTDLAKAIVDELERQTGRRIDPAVSVESTIAAIAASTDISLLVILDQFEDYFLYHGSANADSAFAEEFPQLVNDRRLPVNFLVSIREDAIAQLDRFKDRIPGLLDARLRVRPLMGAAARQAVTGPIERYNELVGREAHVSIEDELVTAVLAQVTVGEVRRKHAGQGLITVRDSEGERDIGTGGFRPDGSRGVEASYLQLVMRRLWDHEQNLGTPTTDSLRKLRLVTLQELGGAQKIVREHLDEALGDLSPDESDAAVEVFQYLVTPSGSKITQGLGTLAVWSHRSKDEVRSLLTKLERDPRIIRPVPPEPGTDEPRYEIFHDVLADAILDWSADKSEKRRLAILAQDNARLENEKRQAELRAAVERRRRVFAVALLLLALAGGAAALFFWRSAASERNTAQREKANVTYVGLASTAQALLHTRPDISLLLALEGYLHTPPDSSRVLAEGALMSALEAVLGSRVLAILHGHLDTVTSVAFDPSGRLLASASGDGTIRLWNTQTHTQVGQPFTANGGAVTSVAFSPTGDTLASAYQDGRIRLWNVHSDRLIQASTGSATSIAIRVAFSHDSRELAAASLDGDVRLWHLVNHERLGPLHTLHFHASDIAFSNDSRLLAAVGADRTGPGGRIVLWDVRTRRRLDGPHTGRPLYSAAFSPIGHALVVGGLEGTLSRWDLGKKLMTLGKGLGSINDLAFSRTGELASASSDGKVQLWTVTGRKAGPPLVGGTGLVTSVAFSPDGAILASGSSDRTIRLWATHPRRAFLQTLKHSGQNAYAVAIAPVGHTVAWALTARYLGPSTSTIQLWDSARDKLIRQIRDTALSGVTSLAFSPDGRLLASTQGKSVKVWNVRTGKPAGKPIDPGVYTSSVAFGRHGWLAIGGFGHKLELWNPAARTRRLPASSAGVYAVAFNPSGTLLASGGDDRRIQLWNVAAHHLVGNLTGHTLAVFTLAFSPNGLVLGSGSGDDTVRLWNVLRKRQIGQPLTGHTGWVRSVAFSRDGRVVASGSADGTIRLWDVTSETQLGEPLASDGFVNSVAFSPSGSTLVSGSKDGSIRFWGPIGLPRNHVALTAEVCRLVGAGLSPQERSRYAPGLAYHNPCR